MPRPQARHMNYNGYEIKTLGTQVQHAIPHFYPDMEHIKGKDMKPGTDYYYELREPCKGEGEGCKIDKFIVQFIQRFPNLSSIRIKIMKVIKNPSKLIYEEDGIYTVQLLNNHTYDGSIYTATYYKMKSPGILANNLLPPYVGETDKKYIGVGGKRKTKKGTNKRKQTKKGKKKKVKTIKKNKKN